MSLAEELAGYELGWWQAHHRKDSEGLIENMAKLHEKQFKIPYERAREAVVKRVEATKEHDIAEKFEDEGNKPRADEHWANVRGLLTEYFALLLHHQNDQTE